MGLCDLNWVMLRTKRARCALYKEIFDYLTRKVFVERSVVELVYTFDEKSTATF